MDVYDCSALERIPQDIMRPTCGDTIKRAILRLIKPPFARWPLFCVVVVVSSFARSLSIASDDDDEEVEDDN